MFEKKIVRRGRVYCAINYSLANCTFVAVDGGYVLIDASPSVESATEIRTDIERRVSGPVQAIIYTHSHPDHTGGASVFHRPGIKIWAQEKFLREMRLHLELADTYFRRAAKQFGYGLDSSCVTTNGIGPPLQLGRGPAPPLIPPTDTFGDRVDLDVGNVDFQLHWAPGETPDQLFVWMPGERTLLAADNIYRAFPNLYALRGVPPRPADVWIQSLDKMRYLDPPPEYLVLGHTDPVEGADQIHQLLTDYRDAIAFVHDSVVRMTNDGRSPDDMVREIRLPEHLRRHPFLQEVYGTLKGGIRGIYNSYIGWYDGDAENLDPYHPADLSARLVPALGGERKMLDQAERAIADGDDRWAVWLCARILALKPRHHRACQLQAQAYRRLAEDQPNPLMRHWYLSDALSREDPKRSVGRTRFNLETIRQLPIDQFMKLLPLRVNPRTARRIDLKFGFEITDLGKDFTFFIRRGVGEMIAARSESPDLLFRGTDADLKALMVGELKPASRAFWERIEFVVAGNPMTAAFRRLRLLLTFARCLIKPTQGSES